MRHFTLYIGFVLSILSTSMAFFPPIKIDPARRKNYKFYYPPGSQVRTGHVDRILNTAKAKVKKSGSTEHCTNNPKDLPYAGIVKMMECRPRQMPQKKGKGPGAQIKIVGQ
ncbi:hypothetical protein PGT21_001290 [Puccinia graminis f. sp. tritici]|uniref:Uncharacterized protein n=1 Tax=Puccinia graminis f. sp. tritici TaxID=56615 RepID=A0A5B0P1E7_PUCGR|nr:hypothetical protein PGT21_001290 [Puccinia graminis f. sp. tritici]KAA1134551.1 hypothetical protein PGTUg99_003176 [Puccinia graminis f. sp. tritici]